jgi:hypothetical protein
MMIVGKFRNSQSGWSTTAPLHLRVTAGNSHRNNNGPLVPAFSRKSTVWASLRIKRIIRPKQYDVRQLPPWEGGIDAGP